MAQLVLWIIIQIILFQFFLSPPNLEELRKRLVLRSTETEDEINKRLSRLKKKDNLKKVIDYNLINDNFETTFRKN